MIVEAKDDVLVLSGSLTQNHWDTIRTAAQLILNRHPDGAIIDCGLITDVTEEGVKTFRDALHYIESQHARIIVANVPQSLREALTQVPGVRSQLPICDSVEAARASLTLSASDSPNVAKRASAILVAVSGLPEEVHAVRMAARLAQQRKGEVHLVFFIEMPRSLPIGTPLPEQESHARITLDALEPLIRKLNVPVARHVERARDWSDTAVRMAIEIPADTMIVTMPVDIDPRHDPTEQMLSLLRRAPCEVFVYRGRREGK